ncbi:pseudouridine synthase [Xanthobacter sp. V2C-8]|uniref:pseudouridine synthase n=1 Tax=Xanthobacter albus TaxID=3119929 RepID=UPI00372C1C93
MPRTTPPRKDKNNVPRLKRELPAAPKKEAERIAKVVARAGLASRREIEEWIAEGRIAVNGEVLTSPAVTVTAKDKITVDGAPLPEKERTRLFIYHKPRGVVTTNRDPEGRATLFEILPQGLPRLVSVGRLDLNSEGLLLLTNDGGLARVLELPETGWLRRYRVRANGEIDQAKLDTLIKGITVDGVEYGPIEAELDRVQGANAWITVSLREGKNREVRNVLGALGLKVNRLIRVSYGPFQLGEIPECGIDEVRTRVLKEQIGAELAAAAGADFEGPVVEREIEQEPDAARRLAARMAEDRAERAAARASAAEGQVRNEGQVRDEFRPAGPRTRRRIAEDGALESRGTVADRKGRAVKVERLAARPDERPARDGRGFGRPTGGRRFEEEGRAPFREGDERPRRPRGEGAPRRFEEDRPRHGKGGFGGGFSKRAEGERGFRPRDGERRDDFRKRDDRPGRSFGEGGENRRPSHGKGGFGGGFRDRAEGERGFRPREGERRDDFRKREDRPGRGFGEGGENRRPSHGKGGFGGGFRDRAEGERGFRPREGERRDDFRKREDRPGRGFGEGGENRRPAHGKGGFGGGFRDRAEGERGPRGTGFSGRSEGGEGAPRVKNFGGKSFGNKSFGDRQERRGPPKEGFKGGPRGAAKDGARPGGFKGGKPFGKAPRAGGPGKGGGRPAAPRGKR